MQIVLALIMVVGIFFVSHTIVPCQPRANPYTQLPESPRWLAKHGRDAEALAVIAALEDKDYTAESVQLTYHGIHEALAAESGSDMEQRSPLRDVFTNGRSQNFRRAFLGVVNQCFQQISGINLITYYAVSFLRRFPVRFHGGLTSIRRRSCSKTWASMTSIHESSLLQTARSTFSLVSSRSSSSTVWVVAR